jgi:D-alanyl-D-alanine dipeptidase
VLLLSDPSIAAIPLQDNGEELVDLRTLPDLLLDDRKQDPGGAWAHLRRGVAERVLTAQSQLPDGVRLLVVEGHRPPSLQRHYFESHRDDVRRLHPDWSDDQLTAETSKHVSPPEVAPHPCGAAIDLTLIADGAELDLGTPVNATPEASSNACFTDAVNITDEARQWRAVLSSAMAAAGLVNYPAEWWHWSYGDRYWAATTGAPHAIYGPRLAS